LKKKRKPLRRNEEREFSWCVVVVVVDMPNPVKGRRNLTYDLTSFLAELEPFAPITYVSFSLPQSLVDVM
jgi:hypothetical protein